MIKFIVLLTRKSGTTREEFSRYWHDVHASVVLKTFPDVKRYIQNHLVNLPGGGEPKCDGVAESWFDDLETWRRAMAAYADERGMELREDEEKFLDRGKMTFFVCEEKVIKP